MQKEFLDRLDAMDEKIGAMNHILNKHYALKRNLATGVLLKQSVSLLVKIEKVYQKQQLTYRYMRKSS